jgi:hypothetical protein
MSSISGLFAGYLYLLRRRKRCDVPRPADDQREAKGRRQKGRSLSITYDLQHAQRSQCFIDIWNLHRSYHPHHSPLALPLHFHPRISPQIPLQTQAEHQRLSTIQSRLRCLSPFQLIVPGRVLLHRGSLVQVEREFLLFSKLYGVVGERECRC